MTAAQSNTSAQDSHDTPDRYSRIVDAAARDVINRNSSTESRWSRCSAIAGPIPHRREREVATMDLVGLPHLVEALLSDDASLRVSEFDG